MRSAVFSVALLHLAWVSSAEFDFIVVGAGPAGCAVSAGLADDDSTSVLVLEAGRSTMWNFGGREQREYFTRFGGDTNVTVFDVPIEAPSLAELTDYWWETAPWTAQGKGVGGSGAVNGGLSFKGDPNDFVTWPPGWGFADLDVFYDEAIKTTGVSAVKSTDGLLYNQASADALDRLVRKQLGFRKKPLNGPGQRANTSSLAESVGKNGQRFESCLGYLLPALRSGKNNIKLMTESTVKHIKFASIGSASGVELEDGMEVMLNPGGKLVLAAGPLNTPKILMYSGVGPEKELQRLEANGLVLNPKDIWVKNEEVGVGLHDHLLAGVQARHPDNETRYIRNPDDPKAASDFFNHRTNFFTQFYTAGLAFLALPGSSNPDIEIGVLGETLFGFPVEDCYACFEAFVLPMLPKSRGNLQIKTPDLDCDCGGLICNTGDFCKPDSYLSNPQDREDFIWGIKTFVNALIAEGFEIITPPAIDDAGIRAYVAEDPRATLPTRHNGGSCSIGRCTDDNLKVRGTENVFVADSSTFPTQVSCHTMLTAIAIGRKAVSHVRNG